MGWYNILRVDDEWAITAHKLGFGDMHYGQPVRQAAELLGFLGELTSNARKLPITYVRWPKVSETHMN